IARAIVRCTRSRVSPLARLLSWSWTGTVAAGAMAAPVRTLLGCTPKARWSGARSMTVLDLAPDHLAFGVQPSNVLTGAALAPAATVPVQDQLNNLASGDTRDRVHLTIARAI